MAPNTPIAAAGAGRRSRWPARLDLAQSASGVLLALFMWAHMFFVASILLGKDAMWTVARFFEGYFLFGRAYPWMVSLAVAGVLVLIVVHAGLALRRFPASFRQFRDFRTHAATLRHGDTGLWPWQVFTGFAMFFLASPHLAVMLTRPDRIGPFASADRVWSEHFWPIYLLLLFAVEIHGGVGLYRAFVKWAGPGPDGRWRARLKRLKWVLTAFFLILGLATLAAYMRIGIEHRDRYGEAYVPTHLQAPADATR